MTLIKPIATEPPQSPCLSLDGKIAAICFNSIGVMLDYSLTQKSQKILDIDMHNGVIGFL